MESCEVEENANFKCSYNLKIISNMAQFQKLTNDVFLHISPEMPFQLIYNLDDNNYVRFFLAPKISDD
jgi:proliferating cell nuclear antigen